MKITVCSTDLEKNYNSNFLCIKRNVFVVVNINCIVTISNSKVNHTVKRSINAGYTYKCKRNNQNS